MSTTSFAFLWLALASPPAVGDPPPRTPWGERWDAFGELRLRLEQLPPLPIDDLGTRNDQRRFLQTRLRLGGAAEPVDGLRLVGELEAFSGLAAGDTTEVGTRADDDVFHHRRDRRFGTATLRPRQGYLRVDTPVGRVTAGLQSFLWGTGMLAHDGVTPGDFGDTWQGNLVVRVGFGTEPAPGVRVFLGADRVYADDTARWADDDEAWGGVLGVRHEPGGGRVLGLLVAVRHQTDRLDPLRPDGARSWVSVMTGDVYTRLPLGAGFQLEAEGAVISGRSTRPYLEETRDGPVGVRSFGAVLRGRHDAARLGLTSKLELGFAGGDNDPRDATHHTFAFNTDYNVGLVLFDHYLPLVSARSADRAVAPALVAVPPSGLRYTVHQGAVANALYAFPRAIWKPRPWLDLRFGYLLAWSAADFVDVYQSALAGGHDTTPGGDTPGRRFLGHELDGAVRFELGLVGPAVARVGFEAGVLLPGAAHEGLGREPAVLGRGLAEVTF